MTCCQTLLTPIPQLPQRLEPVQTYKHIEKTHRIARYIERRQVLKNWLKSSFILTLLIDLHIFQIMKCAFHCPYIISLNCLLRHLVLDLLKLLKYLLYVRNLNFYLKPVLNICNYERIWEWISYIQYIISFCLISLS